MRLKRAIKEYLTECLTSSTSLREINIMSIRPCIRLADKPKAYIVGACRKKAAEQK